MKLWVKRKTPVTDYHSAIVCAFLLQVHSEELLLII